MRENEDKYFSVLSTFLYAFCSILWISISQHASQKLAKYKTEYLKSISRAANAAKSVSTTVESNDDDENAFKMHLIPFHESSNTQNSPHSPIFLLCSFCAFATHFLSFLHSAWGILHHLLSAAASFHFTFHVYVMGLQFRIHPRCETFFSIFSVASFAFSVPTMHLHFARIHSLTGKIATRLHRCHCSSNEKNGMEFFFHHHWHRPTLGRISTQSPSVSYTFSKRHEEQICVCYQREMRLHYPNVPGSHTENDEKTNIKCTRIAKMQCFEF